MPGEDVLINFVGDTSSLVPVENALDGIIAKDAEVGAAWKKTSEAMNAQSQTSVDNTNKLAKSLEQLLTSTKSMDKVVIGGAFAKYLKDIQSQLQLTNVEMLRYLENIKKNAQQGIVTSTDEKEIGDYKQLLSLTNDQIALYTQSQKNARLEGSNFTTQLRAIRNEILALTESEKENPDLSGKTAERLSELTEKYAEVQRIQRQFQIKSEGLVQNNEVIAGTISLVGGLAGGYAVAQGAAALFGSQNDEVQKALLKVNAAMAILQGLQQVTAVLQKSSAASILLESLARKSQTTAIVENTTAAQQNVAVQTEQIATAEAVTVAEGAQAVATDVATASTEALNATMAVNPVLLVLTGVLALITAINALNSSNNAAEKIQNDVNDALKKAGEYLDIDLKANEDATNIIVANAKRRGVSSSELTAIEGEQGNKRLQRINEERNALGKKYNEEAALFQKIQDLGGTIDKGALEDHQKLLDKQFELDKKYTEEYNSLLVKQAEFRKEVDDEAFKSFVGFQNAIVAGTRAGSDAEKSAQINSIKQIGAEREKTADFIALTEGEKAQKRAEDEKQIQGLELANYQHYLKGRTSLFESYVADAKLQIIRNQTDSIESINKVTDLQIAALRKQRDEAIKSDPNLNSGETRKIIAENNLQIAELEKAKQLKILEIQKSGINAQLILSEKGTQEEYDNKIAFINKEQQIELAATELSQEKINEINAKYQKQKEDALKAFSIVQLQNQINIANAELDQFGINENEKLTVTLKRLDEQKQIEIINAEKNQSKITEINAKYDKQIRDAKIASIDAIKNKELEAYTANSHDIIKLNEKIIASEDFKPSQQIAALENIKKEKEDELNIEFSALEKKKGLIDDYDVKYKELLNKRKDLESDIQSQITEIQRKEIGKRISDIQLVFSIFQKGLQETLGTTGLSVALAGLQNFGVQAKSIFDNLKVSVKEFNDILNNPDASEDEKSAARISKHNAEIKSYEEVAVAAIATIQDVVNQIFADGAAQRQQQLSDTIAALEEQKATELNAKNLTEQQKADVDRKYKAIEKQEKIRAFEADKQAKIEQAEINAALAITQAFASNPFPYDLIVAGIVAAATLIQISKIKSAQPPRFRHGEIDIQGPGTTTSDSIHARISKGESVIAAEPTAKWKEALKAINNDNFEQYIKNEFIYPHVPEFVKPSTTQNIDYKLLAKEIASEMKGVIPESKSIHMNIDKDGIHALVLDGNSKTEYKNKRYSMP